MIALKVKVIQVIEVTTTKELPLESGLKIGDIILTNRKVKQYYDLSGKLLAERDITQKHLEELSEN